ncbi:hypothetical protein CBR_g20190 [Chara braunii]|uniref:Uncharacterized protein n=1 Tax=Chara braunii TaxID=69332 RepID=A0A388KZS2_CHABU|nr:hypothetical protein CBR_g20190 [Chara braunii]|eukprot:GBG75559.1 hypothetical protein CBR_g20190 [Chara braunii]
MKQNVALRFYFPLAMARENIRKLAMEFFENWKTGRLLSHDGAKWIVKKKKVKNVKPGVAYIDNDKLGKKEVVYNVPVEPPTRKGKKKKEEGDWFVQVPDPDAHCWKAMESLIDNEKCRVLKKVPACEVLWVQAGSLSLAKLEKLSVQDMVQLVKCNRVLVQLWNYYQFKHEKRSGADWIQKHPFLKSRSVVFKKFESWGLDDDLWDGSRKYVSDSTLFKDRPPYMGCEEDHSIEATEKLVGHKKLTVDWRNKVLSVLTGSSLKSQEIALAEGIVLIKWKDMGDVTSIAPFGNDPLETDIMSAEVKEAVAATKSNMFVLDLCEPVDLKPWKPQSWETLNSYLQTWCPSHWTLVVFVPQQQNLSFLASMHHPSFVKLLEGKWVRRKQQKTSFPVGNNLYTEDDCMYILFKGDNLRVNTSVIYEGRQLKGVVAAVRKKGEGVVFLGKPHARSVWELLKAGRHVVVMEGNSDLLQFTMQLVKSEVNSGAHNCEFMVVKAPPNRVWSNKTDMWFKLSERKRNKIYDFLFLQTRPRKDTDAEYVSRKDHMLALLDNHHFASRMNAKTFLERLQSLYFVEFEKELKLGNYASLISTDDEAATDVEFDANAKEEESDTESLDLHLGCYRQLLRRNLKSVGIRTTSVEEPPERSAMQSHSGLGTLSQDPPEREQRPPGLQREATSAGTADTGTTKSAEIRTSSDGGCRPGIVESPREAACMDTEGRASGLNTGTGDGAQLQGREVGEEMEGGKESEEAEEKGEEGEEGEERGERELIELLEGREGARGDVSIGDDEEDDSEDDGGSGESSNGFGQLYGEHHEDDVNNDATATEMETQVVSSLSVGPDYYEVQPLASAVDLQHRFEEAPVAMSPSKASRRISIDEVIDGILRDQHVSAHPSSTHDGDDADNITSSVAAALASSPLKSQGHPRQRRGRRGQRTTTCHVTEKI